MNSDAEIVERLRSQIGRFRLICLTPAEAQQTAEAITRLTARVEELEREMDLLRDPIAVHANMLRGTIAKPSLSSFLHAVGGEALTALNETVRIASRNEQSPHIDLARSLLSPSHTMKE